MSDDWCADVARKIADRAIVDWDGICEAVAASTDPSLVAELRVLEQVARVHTAPPADAG